MCLGSDEESFASLLGSPRGGLGARELERHNTEIQNAMSAVDSHLQQLIENNGDNAGAGGTVRDHVLEVHDEQLAAAASEIVKTV